MWQFKLYWFFSIPKCLVDEKSIKQFSVNSLIKIVTVGGKSFSLKQFGKIKKLVIFMNIDIRFFFVIWEYGVSSCLYRRLILFIRVF